MKKETIVAISLGIAAGVGIALFVIISSRRANPSTADVILDSITPTVSITTQATDPLLIKQPENELVTPDESISIAGSTQPGSLVVIQTPDSEQIIRTERKEFTANVDLLPGENVIRITSYNGKNADSRTLTLYSIAED